MVVYLFSESVLYAYIPNCWAVLFIAVSRNSAIVATSGIGILRRGPVSKDFQISINHGVYLVMEHDLSDFGASLAT